MYKAILFDLDNTLMSFEGCVWDALLRTRESHQLYVGLDDEWKAFTKRYEDHSYTHWMNHVNGRGLPSIREVMDITFRDSLSAPHLEGHDAISKAYWDYFCQSSVFEKGAERLLSELHGSVKLGMISNGVGEAQRGRLHTGGVLHMFDTLIISDEVQARKPNAIVFEMALRELGLQADEVLYVGDSLTDDYTGAKNAGVDFCYYNPNKKAWAGGEPPKAVIHHLDELMGILSVS